jgi:hypothetical protein
MYIPRGHHADCELFGALQERHNYIALSYSYVCTLNTDESTQISIRKLAL